MGTRDVADAVLRKSFESSNVSKVSRSKIAPAQQRKWIDSSAVCIHHYFSNLLSTQLRLFGNIRFTLLFATSGKLGLKQQAPIDWRWNGDSEMNNKLLNHFGAL